MRGLPCPMFDSKHEGREGKQSLEMGIANGRWFNEFVVITPISTTQEYSFMNCS